MSARSAKAPSADTAAAAERRLIYPKIAEIIVGDRLRSVLPDRVAALQPSLEARGQMVPVDLVETDEGMRLIFGAHRVAALAAAGAETVMAVLHPKGSFGTEAEIVRREIAENFDRFELTVLERAVSIAAWREIHEAEHGRPKRGRKPKDDDALDELSANFALNFPEVVQRTLGLSRRAVFLALKVASIAPELRDQLAPLPIADNQSELLALAAEAPTRQARIVALLAADPPTAESVAAAIAAIDELPPPRAIEPHERISDSFARLKPEDRYRFFDLHADDIDHWLAARGK
ncbi:MAG: ParB N-terminal domain-containing protein [Gammaproteobacteria bacterium]